MFRTLLEPPCVQAALDVKVTRKRQANWCMLMSSGTTCACHYSRDVLRLHARRQGPSIAVRDAGIPFIRLAEQTCY